MTNVTMSDIKALNKSAGRFFFSPDSMRFFESRIPIQIPTVSEIDTNKVFFVTTETNFDNTARYAHVRCIDMETGYVDSAGEDFRNVRQAKKAIREFVKGRYLQGYEFAMSDPMSRRWWGDPQMSPTEHELDENGVIVNG